MEPYWLLLPEGDLGPLCNKLECLLCCSLIFSSIRHKTRVKVPDKEKYFNPKVGKDIIITFMALAPEACIIFFYRSKLFGAAVS
jgi:hypothetical protein